MERPNTGRRASIGRVWRRLRDVVRHRGSTSPSLQTTIEPTQEAEPFQPNTSSTANAPEAGASETAEGATEAESHLRDKATVLDTEASQDDEDDDELLLPLSASRSGIPTERWRAMLEKYGIERAPQETPGDQTATAQRVERAIRMRVRWMCHSCQCPFRKSLKCASCGHERCPECTRTPSEKVRDAMAATQTPAPAMSVGQSTVAAARKALATPETRSGALPSSSIVGLEKEVTALGIDWKQYHYHGQQHPTRTAMQLVLRSRAQSIWGTCHVCHAESGPKVDASECRSCQHKPCELCPDRASSTTFSPGPLATIQRVYRKPRQRVRWRCDQCEQPFIEKDTCLSCGHQRCCKCIRTPYVIYRHSQAFPRPPE